MWAVIFGIISYIFVGIVFTAIFTAIVDEDDPFVTTVIFIIWPFTMLIVIIAIPLACISFVIEALKFRIKNILGI